MYEYENIRILLINTVFLQLYLDDVRAGRYEEWDSGSEVCVGEKMHIKVWSWYRALTYKRARNACTTPTPHHPSQLFSRTLNRAITQAVLDFYLGTNPHTG
jgi:hypothetical protein